MKGKTKILAPVVLVSFLIALWWVAVAVSETIIVPTPWRVVLGVV